MVTIKELIKTHVGGEGVIHFQYQPLQEISGNSKKKKLPTARIVLPPSVGGMDALKVQNYAILMMAIPKEKLGKLK